MWTKPSIHSTRAASDSVTMGLNSVISQQNLAISNPILFIGNHELKTGFFRDLNQ